MTRTIRIISGLVLFAFAATHLVNAAFGLHSIEAMDAARPYLLGPWSNPVGSFLLIGSFFAHTALGFVAIYWRSTLRMSTTDGVQLAASLAIVPLLTPHVIGTAVAAQYGIVPSYASLIPYFWIWAPEEGLRQVLLLAVLWIHGCVGVVTWARIQPWWTRVGAVLQPLAVAIPILALVGFVEAGNQAIEAAENPPPAIAEQAAPPAEAQEQPEAASTLSRDEILAIISRINWGVFYAYLACLAAVMAARQLRLAGERRTLRIAFAEGPTVTAAVGLSVLEIAEQNNVAVAHLCRGRGRCGTCRVVPTTGEAALPEPDEYERATLARVGAGPGERLACQLRPGPGNLSLERVLAPFIRPADLHRDPAAVASPREPDLVAPGDAGAA
jgi:adenylate cyclase